MYQTFYICLIDIIGFYLEYQHTISIMQRQATKGSVLYEQVLEKNFQIIETFLNKFPIIFKKQDLFEDSIKKINQKLTTHDQQQQKLREELHLTTALLEKKINNLKDGSLRNNRCSTRVTQDISPLEERKNTNVFRIASISKEPRDSSIHVSKERMEMLNQIDRKQHEHTKKVNQLQQTIANLKEKINFLSVVHSDLQSKVDHLIDAKVDVAKFQDLSKDYRIRFQTTIKSLVDQKYYLGGKLIQKQVSLMQSSLSKYINNLFLSNKKELLGQIQKKAGINEFKDELGQIKLVIQKIVDQSVQSFANKQQTKKALLLFEKKFQKLEVILQSLLTETMKGVDQQQIKQSMNLGLQKQRQGIMSSFGRKRRICLQK